MLNRGGRNRPWKYDEPLADEAELNELFLEEPWRNGEPDGPNQQEDFCHHHSETFTQRIGKRRRWNTDPDRPAASD